MKMQNQFSSSSFPRFFNLLLILVITLVIAQNVGIIRVAEGGKSRIHIPDELDDVIDDEEDEDWKNWGKKKSNPSKEFDPPPMDFSKMELPKIQEEMMKRNTGPAFGFVKLQVGVPRSPDLVTDIAMKWTKVLKTGGVDAKFMGVDVNTIMFTMDKGLDTLELKEFVLSQPEAYEIKIGDQIHRRPGDPPIGEAIEMLRRQRKADNLVEDSESTKDEL